MKRNGFLVFVMVLLLMETSFTSIATANSPTSFSGLRAGVSKVKITPEQPMWMAGYAARNHEGNGPALWKKNVEKLIFEESIRLAKQVNLPQKNWYKLRNIENE